MLNDAITPARAAELEAQMGFQGDDPQAATAAKTSTGGLGRATAEVRRICALLNVAILREEPEACGIKFILEHCIFNDSHRGKDAAFFAYDSGGRHYNCFHSSCSDRTWKEARDLAEPGYRDRAPAANRPAPSATTTPASSDDSPVRTYRKITCAELASGDFRQEYLVDGVYVAGQPCIIAGSHKTLKTSILIDLAVSLDLGGHFLGYFKTTRRARIGVMSGESGLATLQETAHRIFRAAGHRLEDGGILWSDELPKFGDTAHLDAIADFIKTGGLEILVVDPAYLAMPSGNEGSVFAQGELLRSVSDVCQKHGTSLALAHHLRKNRADAFAPPTLEEIAWSGFSEFARQWLLLGRRERYVPGTGDHKLWLSVGGSAGHSGLYGLDVQEGVQSDPAGRRWDVSVRGVKDTAAEIEKTKERKATAKAAEQDAANERKIRDALRQFPEGESARMLRTVAGGMKPDPFGKAIQALLAAGRAEACSIMKNNRSEDAFKPTSQT